jgi:hypothetical protein
MTPSGFGEVMRKVNVVRTWRICHVESQMRKNERKTRTKVAKITFAKQE